MFDEDEVTLLDFLAFLELFARLGDVPDVLVPHDHGILDRRVCVELHIGAADARDLDFQQRAVIGDIRHRKLLEFDLMRARAHGRNDLLSQCFLLN